MDNASQEKNLRNFYKRKELIEQIMEIIFQDEIEIMVADFNFVGEDWLYYLYNLKFSFTIRVKKNERVKHNNGGWVQFNKFFTNIATRISKTIEAPFVTAI